MPLPRVPDGLGVVLDAASNAHVGAASAGIPVTAYVVLDSLSGGRMSACQYGITVDPRLLVIGRTHHPRAVFVNEGAENDFVVGFNPPLADYEGPYILLTLELLLAPEHAGAHDLRVDVRPLGDGRPMVWARSPQTWEWVRMVDVGGTLLNPTGYGVVALATVPEVAVLGREYLLHWNTYGSDEVRLQGQPAPTRGTVAFTASAPRTFDLSVGPPDDPATRTVQVEPIQAPRIRALRWDPPSPTLGQRVHVEWEFDGADEVRLDPGGQIVGAIGDLGFDLQASTALVLRATNEWGTTPAVAAFNLDGVPLVAYFEALPDAVDRGQQLHLRWHVVDADAVSIEPEVGPVPPAGEAGVAPAATTTYRLVASNAQGTREAQAHVEVYPVRIIEFHADPNIVYAGRPTTLRYQMVNATQAWIEPGIGVVPVPSGTVQVTPAANGEVYVLHASDGSAQVTSSTRVAWKPPDVTLAGPGVTFAARVPVEWSVAGADTARIDPLIGPIGPEGTGTIWVPAGTEGRAYTLWARNAQGEAQDTYWYTPQDSPLSAALETWPYYVSSIGERVTLRVWLQNALGARLDPQFGPIPVHNNALQYFPVWADEPTTWTLTAWDARDSVTDSVHLAPVNRMVDLVADPATIRAGDISTLRWTYSSAANDSVKLLPLGLHVIQRMGSLTVQPETTQTYELVGWFHSGGIIRIVHDLATVEVVGPVVALAATPAVPPAGTEFDLQVRIREYEAARLDPAPGSIPPQDAVYRFRADRPTTYRLVAFAGADSHAAQLTVTPGPPLIEVWRAEPTTITIGEAATLSWSVSAADSVVIEPGHRVSAALAGSVTVSPARTRSFYLNVYLHGTVTQATTILDVQAPEPPPDGERLMLVADPETLEPSVPHLEAGQPVTVYAVVVRPSIPSGAFGLRVDWPPCLQPTSVAYPPGGVNFAPAPDHLVGWGSCLTDTIQVLATFTLLPDPAGDPACLTQPHLVVPQPTASGGEFGLSDCLTYESRPFVGVQGIALGGQFTGWEIDALPPPRLLAADGGDGVLLQWQLDGWPPAAVPLSVEIWRAADAAALQFVTSLPPTAREWRDDGAHPGHSYRYVARLAVNGATVASNEVLVQLAGAAAAPVTAVHGLYPNPFSSTMTLDFEVAAPGPVALRVYDVAGRLVRRAEMRVVRAGPAQWQWDGRDGRGRRVSAGAYIVRMEAGGQALAGRVLLLR